MLEKVEMMEVTLEKGHTIPRKMTEKEFDASIDQDVWAEFKDGEVITKMPALLRHELLFQFLLMLLSGFVRARDLGIVVGSQYAIRLRPGLRRVPDLIFVSKERMDIVQERFVQGAPDLAIEIVSADSMSRDWREKYLEYQNAGVREYWVFDPQSGYSEWYSLQDAQYVLIPLQDGAYHSRVVDGFLLLEEWLEQERLPDPLTILHEWKIV